MAVPVSETKAKAAKTSIAAACVQITRRRVSNRSTIEPAKSPNRVYGTKRQKSSRATAIGECDSERNSHARATFCIHEPASETTMSALAFLGVLVAYVLWLPRLLAKLHDLLPRSPPGGDGPFPVADATGSAANREWEAGGTFPAVAGDAEPRGSADLLLPVGRKPSSG